MADQENREDALERLFREKAQEYDISYREEDWQELEDRLDNVDQQHKQRTRRRLIAAAVALIISALAYFIFQNQQQINKLNEQLSSRQNQPPAIEQRDADDNPQSPDTETSSNSVANQDTQIAVTQNSNTDKKSGSDANEEKNEGRNQTEDSQQLPAGENRTFVSYSLTEQQPLAIPKAGGEQNRMMSTDETQLAEAGSFTPQTVQHPAEETESAAQPVPASVSRRSSPLSLGLVLGPDLSTAGGIDHFYDPGYKIGVTVDYNISPRLAITSGIIRTRTRYTASGGEYRAPSGYWTNGITPDKTKANCVLLDIPVSMKYRFLQFSNSSLYATAGVSSYIMLDEQYRFEYESEYYQADLKQSWDEKTGTRHWMSNASFSLGYELDIFQNWSLRAEPFLKVPIKKIGWGNVNLYSMGTMVSLNFNLPGRP